MPNNPVQIVLNAQNYVQKADITAGGSNKDFYAGRDEAFALHRKDIATQMLKWMAVITMQLSVEVRLN